MRAADRLTACGRVTVTLPSAPAQPVWYLVTPNVAFVLDTSPAVMSGSFQSQSPPANGFGVASILGSYLGSTITPVLPSVTNEVDVGLTPCCGGVWDQQFDASGPYGTVNQALFSGGYNCGMTYPTCDSRGTAFGRFIVTGPGSGTSNVEIIYVIGAGAGTTGSKGGLVGLNVDSSPTEHPIPTRELPSTRSNFGCLPSRYPCRVPALLFRASIRFPGTRNSAKTAPTRGILSE